MVAAGTRVKNSYRTFPFTISLVCSEGRSHFSLISNRLVISDNHINGTFEFFGAMNCSGVIICEILPPASISSDGLGG